MKVGLVSPYPWDVPGGVVQHVRDLAGTLIELGHDVSVITPVDDEDVVLPSYVTRAGRSVPVPYNGAVARLTFGPLSLTRVRRWLHDGDFDVLHLHSPETFSLSLLALMNARGPIVATFHAAQMRSRILAVLQSPLQVHIEKIVGRIAVSPAARKTIVEHLGADAVVVPNGVHVERFADAAPLDGWPSAGGAIGFVGRIDEPRKGLSVLLEAMPYLWKEHPLLRLLIAGPGEIDDRLDDRVVLLGQVDDKTKARAYHSVDAFVAPNIGGESFGIILLEAMAAGTPVVASDLDAFRRVLETTDGSSAGVLATVGDPESLAHAIATVLGSDARRNLMRKAGMDVVRRYDWSVVAQEIVRVYEMTIAASPERHVIEEPEAESGEAFRALAARFNEMKSTFQRGLKGGFRRAQSEEAD